MNFCLSDLVPPLRWSDAARITTLTDRPDLPDAWWRTLPLHRVLAVLDAEALGDLLTELALDHWPAAAVGDVLPALHVLDPDEADDPHVAIALDRAGSWHGLLALSGRELADQPFVKARPVLTALFTAVFLRMSPEEAGPIEEPTPEPVPEPVAEPISEPVPEPVAEAASEPAGPVAGPPDEQDLPELIDAAFADLDDQTWMVAQNRVFTEEPSDPEQLAKLLAVPPAVIHDLEAALRDRLRGWLTLPEAAPYHEHLARLTDAFGAAAPKERLVAAAGWHGRELRSLEVPAWRFVLATLPRHRLYGDWLVAGDIEDLRERTRKLIASAERPPTISQALEMVASLGVRPDVARQWLDSVPQLRAQKASEVNAPDRQPDRQQDRQQGGLKDVALTRRCFRQPDGRWWLRVDVSGDHLDGGEVALPSGFAAYVGLAPGEDRTVRSAAGEVALSWHARPALGSLQRILSEVSAEEGSHIFLTLSEEGVLRVRHLPAAAGGDETSRALRLVGYTAPGGTPEQAAQVIATRVGLAGPVDRPALLARLRERGDRDLLALLG
ncbi:hypothetical protein GCM10010116_56070 [Microbispora rosea subsp. aerata]|nr:hypothetical protein [Microbispora rosea]GGO27970.1 hypothetical protein GCM10010116_56070 [Microbispora rosea subsp. aerata]GIH56989.1 hypothetical protein Mro02_39030 [Microbispora rosea subsp. aerata]GLJ82916.1 hypothetical protein GCM10017588_16420 [Microbispora rosea subsp. aerata]